MTTNPNPVRALLLDWAGTTIDYGSLAPAGVFQEIFRACGVEVTQAEARGPMGMAKRDHIAEVLKLPRVAAAWGAKFGKAPEDADVDRLYQQFLPLQKRVLAKHAVLIPGVLDLVATCRKLGIRIGSTTGYTRELMEVVVPLAAAEGYAPEVVVCSDDVPAGRPAPWSNFRAAEALGIYPIGSILVVDDTVAGIRAGVNAGMRSIGVTRSGNAIGLAEAEVDALPAEERLRRLTAAEREFFAAGAECCVESVAELAAMLRSGMFDGASGRRDSA